MYRKNLFTLCFLLFGIIKVTIAQQDSTYSYVYICDSCGKFETISFEPIELETNVAISLELLPDTSTNTLAQFATSTLRKGVSASSIFKTRQNNFNIYPNPANTNYYLYVEAENKCKVDILIYDLYGRKIVSYEKILQKEMNVLEMPVDGLISGNYIVRINFDSYSIMKKLLISK